MKINRIELIPINAQQGLIAFASIILDNSIFLGSIGVHKCLREPGYRLTYPTKKIGTTHMALYHPITPFLSKHIEEAIGEKAAELFENH